MTQQQNPDADQDLPTVYQFRLHGLLDPLWSDWFDRLAITWHHGDRLLIRRIRDLGLPLVSINRVRAAPSPTTGSNTPTQRTDRRGSR